MKAVELRQKVRIPRPDDVNSRLGSWVGTVPAGRGACQGGPGSRIRKKHEYTAELWGIKSNTKRYFWKRQVLLFFAKCYNMIASITLAAKTRQVFLLTNVKCYISSSEVLLFFSKTRQVLIDTVFINSTLELK
jgi:hypothetical protein